MIGASVAWKPDWPASASVISSWPWIVRCATGASSVTSPVSSPEISGWSLVPVTVMVTVFGVATALSAPLSSWAVTVKVNDSV